MDDQLFRLLAESVRAGGALLHTAEIKEKAGAVTMAQEKPVKWCLDVASGAFGRVESESAAGTVLVLKGERHEVQLPMFFLPLAAVREALQRELRRYSAYSPCQAVKNCMRALLGEVVPADDAAVSTDPLAQELALRFPLPPSETLLGKQAAAYTRLCHMLRATLQLIKAEVPKGRERALAVSKLEACALHLLGAL